MAVVEQQERLDPNSEQDGGDDWMKDLTEPERQGLQKEGLLDKDGNPKAPVPENHPTKLGRKVKEMGERLGKLDSIESQLAQLSQMMTANQELLTKTQEARRSVQSEQLDEEVPEHIKEALPYLKKELNREQAQADKAKTDYIDKYMDLVRKPRADVDEELHKEVVNELLDTNFRNYKKISGDPTYDANTNYDLAVATVLKRARSGKKAAPNVRGDRENAPLGLSSTSRNTVEPVKKIEPDEFARKFIRSIGAKEDDEWVQESLRSAK